MDDVNAEFRRRPIVYGHSMGGFVAMLYGSRHPGNAGALILQSTMARFDLARLVEGFRRAAGDEVAELARRSSGDEVAELARRSYGGDPVSDAEWTRVFAAFGPRVPDAESLGRRISNAEVGAHGLELLHTFDVVDQLGRIDCPTLVCVGERDAVTPPEAAREIYGALPGGLGRLEVIEGAGHVPWKDAPDPYLRVLQDFVTAVSGPSDP